MCGKLLRAVNEAASRHPSPEVMYCSNAIKYTLLMELPHGNSRSVDSIQVAGLSVEELPMRHGGIICERGEVFPIAEQFKSGEARPEIV